MHGEHVSSFPPVSAWRRPSLRGSRELLREALATWGWLSPLRPPASWEKLAFPILACPAPVLQATTLVPMPTLGLPGPPGAAEPAVRLPPQVLIDWVSDVLVEERIIVKQLEEDLYDGQVLQKLLGESVGRAPLPPVPHQGPQLRATPRPGHTILQETSAPSPQLPGGVPGLQATHPLIFFLGGGGWRHLTRAPSHGEATGWPRTASRTVHAFCAVGRTHPRGAQTGVHRVLFPLGPPSLPACALACVQCQPLQAGRCRHGRVSRGCSVSGL